MLEKIKKELLTTQFLRFLMVGGTAATANFFARFLIRPYFNFETSIAMSFVVGTIISFVLNKYFTFSAHDEKTRSQMVKFLIMTAVSIGLATVIAATSSFVYQHTLKKFLDMGKIESLAHITSIGLTTFFNFFAMKYFSFKRLETAAGKDETGTGEGEERKVAVEEAG